MQLAVCPCVEVNPGDKKNNRHTLYHRRCSISYLPLGASVLRPIFKLAPYKPNRLVKFRRELKRRLVSAPATRFIIDDVMGATVVWRWNLFQMYIMRNCDVMQTLLSLLSCWECCVAHHWRSAVITSPESHYSRGKNKSQRFYLTRLNCTPDFDLYVI